MWNTLTCSQVVAALQQSLDAKNGIAMGAFMNEPATQVARPVSEVSTDFFDLYSMDDVQTFFRRQFINGNSQTIMHEGSSAFSVTYQDPDSVTTYFFANSDIRNHVLEICCATKLVKLLVPLGAQVLTIQPSTDFNQGVLLARKDH